jgi:chromosome segregation ATPase
VKERAGFDKWRTDFAAWQDYEKPKIVQAHKSDMEWQISRKEFEHGTKLREQMREHQTERMQMEREHRKELKAKEGQLADREARIAELQARIAEQQARIAEQQARIARLLPD